MRVKTTVRYREASADMARDTAPPSLQRRRLHRHHLITTTADRDRFVEKERNAMMDGDRVRTRRGEVMRRPSIGRRWLLRVHRRRRRRRSTAAAARHRIRRCTTTTTMTMTKSKESNSNLCDRYNRRGQKTDGI